ncbi:MAG: hypothetical protein HYZ45_12855, partial [Burkholderiales bacterium]|nr:hypothetical protein [Burkholderiales bacterium]
MNASQAQRQGFKLDTLFLLAGFAALLLLALWAGVGFQLTEESRNIRADGQARSQAMVRTFAEHCNYILRQADHATHLFQALHNQSNGALTLHHFVHSELNSAHASRSSSALYVDTPVTDSTAQSWTIQMSRRLLWKDGSFAGVILVEIDPLYLVDQYDYSDLSTQGSLILRNINSEMSVQRVGHNITRSKMQVSITPMRIDGEHMTEEKIEVTQIFDKVPRRYNVRELPEFGIQALVGLPISDTTQRFKMYQQMYFAYASAVSLLIIVGTTFLTRQTLRSRRNMRAARDAEGILSSAAEGSLDAFYILRCVRDANNEISDFLITHVNQRGAHMLGIPADVLRGKLLCATLPRFRDDGYFARYVQVVNTGTPLE